MIIKNSYFAAIKTAMSEGKADKWAMFHKDHGPHSYSRYHAPHLEDYCLINSRMLRNTHIKNPHQHWYGEMEITDIFLNTSTDLSVAGAIIASRLELLPTTGWHHIEEQKQEIIVAFRSIRITEKEPTMEELEEFDIILESLYNWGDTLIGTRRICRIRTFGK